MTKTLLSEWFFHGHLDYQRRVGERRSTKDYAEFLGLSQAYITMLINGDREGISLETANKIYERTGDITIYDAAGYPRPNLATEELRPILEKAPELKPDEIEALKELVRKYLREAGYPIFESE